MNLHSEVLARLVTLDTDAGLAELDAAGLSTVENANALALHALDTAEANSTNAYQILVGRSTMPRRGSICKMVICHWLKLHCVLRKVPGGKPKIALP